MQVFACLYAPQMKSAEVASLRSTRSHRAHRTKSTAAHKTEKAMPMIQTRVHSLRDGWMDMADQSSHKMSPSAAAPEVVSGLEPQCAGPGSLRAAVGACPVYPGALWR